MLEVAVFTIERFVMSLGVLSPLFLLAVVLYYIFYWRLGRFRDLLKKISSLLESIFEWLGSILAKFFIYILPLLLVIVYILAKLIRFFWYRT